MNADESKACKESAHAISALKTGAKLGEFCVPCLVFDTEELRERLHLVEDDLLVNARQDAKTALEDLAHTEAALLEARTQRDGASNRVKYLENLIAEAAGKAGEKR